MSEELNQVQPEEELRPEEGQEAEAGTEAAPQPDADEERARRIGWVPLTEFRGDPAKWVDAKEFNRRGDEQVPLLRSTVRRLEQQNEQLQRDMQEFAKFHRQVEEQAHKRAMADLRRQMAEARQAGDIEREMQLEDQVDELRQKAAPKPAAQPEPGQPDPVFLDWLKDNPWANDPEAQAIGLVIGQKLRQQGDTSSGLEYMNKIKKEVMRRYPQLIPELNNPRREQPSAVAQNTSLPKAKKKGFADLPADAKDACRTFVKRGLVTEEQYIKEYFGE